MTPMTHRPDPLMPEKKGTPPPPLPQTTPTMKHYSISEVARLTGKSSLTIKRWVASGKIQPPADPQGFSADEVRAIVDKVARL